MNASGQRRGLRCRRLSRRVRRSPGSRGDYTSRRPRGAAMLLPRRRSRLPLNGQASGDRCACRLAKR